MGSFRRHKRWQRPMTTPPTGNVLHKEAFQVRVWGARGSVPVSGPQYLQRGGDTCCVQVQIADDKAILLDAGTGLRAAGEQFADVSNPQIHLFLSHFHWDHLQGLPFFAPLYQAGAHLTFYSGFLPVALQAACAAQLRPPHFPVSWEHTPSTKSFVQLGAEPLAIGGTEAQVFPLCHPGGAYAVRLISGDGETLVYLTDHESGRDAELDRQLDAASRGVGTLIHDAQYTPAEATARRGWGHSTWRDATRRAHRAEAGRRLSDRCDARRRTRQRVAPLREPAAGDHYLT